MAVRKRFVCVAALATLVPRASGAQDQMRSVESGIAVMASDPCLTHAALSNKIGAWLHRDKMQQRIGIRVRPSSSRVVFWVETDGHIVAERAFDDLPSQCERRLDAVALAIALAIDAAVLDMQHKREPTPQAPPAAATHWTLSAGGVAAHDLLASIAVGAELGGSVGRTPSFGLKLRGFPSSHLGVTSGEASLQMVQALGNVCSDLSGRHVSLGGCVGADVGTVFARGQGYDRSLSPTVWRVGVDGRIVLRWFFRDRWALDSWGGLTVAAIRPKLQVIRTDGVDVGSKTLPVFGQQVGLAVVFASEQGK